jgi:hypothetical protein
MIDKDMLKLVKSDIKKKIVNRLRIPYVNVTLVSMRRGLCDLEGALNLEFSVNVKKMSAKISKIKYLKIGILTLIKYLTILK